MIRQFGAGLADQSLIDAGSHPVPAQDIKQLVQLFPALLVIGGFQRGCDAVLDVTAKNLFLDLAKGRLDGAQLHEDVDAMPVLFNHPANAIDLAANAREAFLLVALPGGLLQVRFHAAMIPGWGTCFATRC